MESVVKCRRFSEAWPPLTGRDAQGYRVSDRVLVSNMHRETIIGFRSVLDGQSVMLDESHDEIHDPISWAPLPEML